MGPPPGAREVVESIAQGRRTAAAVMQDVQTRIALAHKMTNAVVHCTAIASSTAGKRCESNPLADRAQQAAVEADKVPKSERGPLHGLPFSAKECFLLKGTDCTIGIGKLKSVDQVDRTFKENAPLVEALIDAGAIPTCKTNVPQTMYAWECENPVYGRTTCPSSERFVPGGSSGGEGALLGAGGSIVGIGTDIGGSCRIPAHMSGCSGIKPTKFRLPSTGNAPGLIFGAQTAIASVPGVLARSSDDIAAVLSGILTTRGFEVMRTKDPHVVPLPWNEPEFKSTRKLRIGYYCDDGYMTATPVCQRAVMVAVEALRKSGHTVEPFQIGNFAVGIPKAVTAFLALVSSGSKHIANAMRDEDQSPFIVKLLRLAKLAPGLPSVLRHSLLPWVLEHVFGGSYQAELLPILGEKSTTDFLEAQHIQREFAKAWSTQFAEQELDIVICPAHTLPTATAAATGDFVYAANYCFVANLLDWTAGVTPVCRLDQTKDTATDEFWSKVTRAGDTATLGPLRKSYEDVVGSNLSVPVGVQVIGKPYCEELVLRVMTSLDKTCEFANEPFTFASKV